VNGQLADAAFREWKRSEDYNSPFVEKAHCDDPDTRLQLFTYFMEQSPLEKLTSFQFIKKFPAFYGT